MSHALFVGALLGTMLVLRPVPVSAETQAAKVDLGLRTGYGIPIGKLFDREGNVTGDPVNDSAAGQVPIWFDLGARIGEIYVGGYFAYGIVVFSSEFADDCERIGEFAQGLGGSARCSFHGLRFGANAHYHFGAPGAEFDPWLGGGFGYEWLSQGIFVEAEGQEADISATYHGFEFVNVQAGVDLPLSDSAGFGPFIAATLASYQTASGSCSGDGCTDMVSDSEDIDDTALHTWLFLGVRGTFRF